VLAEHRETSQLRRRALIAIAADDSYRVIAENANCACCCVYTSAFCRTVAFRSLMISETMSVSSRARSIGYSKTRVRLARWRMA
jgi:hypothetical protein